MIIWCIRESIQDLPSLWQKINSWLAMYGMRQRRTSSKDTTKFLSSGIIYSGWFLSSWMALDLMSLSLARLRCEPREILSPPKRSPKHPTPTKHTINSYPRMTIRKQQIPLLVKERWSMKRRVLLIITSLYSQSMNSPKIQQSRCVGLDPLNWPTWDEWFDKIKPFLQDDSFFNIEENIDIDRKYAILTEYFHGMKAE